MADVQEGIPSAGGFYLDHRLWLGLHAAQWPDAAGSGTSGPFDAKRFVNKSVTHIFTVAM